MSPVASRTFLVVGLLCTLHVRAEPYLSVRINKDKQSLTLVTAHGELSAPRTLDDQQGFAEARLSHDGRLAGWLVEETNCCTSYPLPTALVVFRDGKVIRSFGEAPPIWAWQFASADTAVAYRQRAPHGPAYVAYKLRRISDGKLLAEYACGPPEEARHDGPVPAWVWPIADECPERKVEK